MPSMRLTRLGALAATSLLLLAACGDDDGNSDDEGAATEPTEEATTTAGDDATEEETSDDASDEDVAEPVTDVFTTFFDNFEGDLALLEDGDTFSDDAIEPMRDRAEAAGSIRVEVDSVTALDDDSCDAAGVIAPCAEVAFDLVVNDEPAVPDQTGYAVFQDDTWKVAATTFCSLAAFGDGLPEGC